MFYTNALQMSDFLRLWVLDTVFMVNPGEPGNAASPGEPGNQKDPKKPNTMGLVVLLIIAAVLTPFLCYGACIYALINS